LTRYLDAEIHDLLRIIENLWEKYAVGGRELETTRSETAKLLDGYLSELGYV
jgi:hypothetical protein